MSDYCHNKVIRLPFPKEILERFNTECAWDCEGFLMEKLGDLYNKEPKGFVIESTDKAQYLDYCYYHTYGEESGDFGNVSLLTENEIKLVRPLFDKLGIVYKDSDLRKVEYCFYNCSECADYYDLPQELTEKDLF